MAPQSTLHAQAPLDRVGAADTLKMVPALTLLSSLLSCPGLAKFKLGVQERPEPSLLCVAIVESLSHLTEGWTG